MTISMYQASVPLFQRQLGALLVWLDKAEARAQARKFDVNNDLQLRQAPDRLPFVAQIRIASDAAKGCVGRLAGAEIPRFEDSAATLNELRARARRTLDVITSVQAAAIDGSEGRDIVIPMRRPREPVQLKRLFFVQHWALPNFCFHITTADALLRQAGVEIGKGDYLAVA